MPRKLLSMQECYFLIATGPFFKTTWTGDTHEEINVLPSSRQDEDG